MFGLLQEAAQLLDGGCEGSCISGDWTIWACQKGRNLELKGAVTLATCAHYCNKNGKCISFEYATVRTATASFGACQLSESCDQTHMIDYNNWDLYIQTDRTYGYACSAKWQCRSQNCGYSVCLHAVSIQNRQRAQLELIAA